jgi:thymidylate synthase
MWGFLCISKTTKEKEKLMEAKWPAFLPNQMELGNLDSNVAVICGWTPRNVFVGDLHRSDEGVIMDKIAAIGQMYTAGRGVDMLVRNLLANPKINVVIFTGRDSSGASSDAMEFFDYERNGHLREHETASGAKYYCVDDAPAARVWANIPIDVVENLRHKLAIAFVPDEQPGEVARMARTLHGVGHPTAGEPVVIPPPRSEATCFPSPYSKQTLRAKTIGEGWLELLHYILTYGRRVPTHYDQDTLEIMDLDLVITEQDPKEFEKKVPKYLPFTPEDIMKYCEGLLSPVKDKGVTYTYGNRMRAHFDVDQLSYVSKKLADDRDSRSVVINLWDAGIRQQGSPCLNHLWFRIMDDKLFMTATIRSNDMFLGWPDNAYGLRFLQDWVRCMILKFEGSFQDDKGLGMGDLVISSQSAHIYEDCWGPAKEIVDKHRVYREWHDEKGQWTFDYAGDNLRKVVATLHSPEGEFLTSIEGTPHKIRREIARRGLISDVGHALYVGQMLERFQRRG